MSYIKVSDYTVDGKCSNCGACCSNLLPISETDIKRIKAYVKKHKIKEQRHNVLGTKTFDMTCPFRDEGKKKCLIYEVRPAICREFLCNHTIDDIRKSKIDFHEKYKLVFMRTLFFGNSWDERMFIGNLFKEWLREEVDG